MADTLHDANAVIETEVRSRRLALERVLDSDVLAYSGPIDSHATAHIKDALELRKDKRESLAFLLETGGGLIEETERIANILRYHYQTVDFLITSYAMSAGTVLTMCGDSIYMDYASTLGPIDPQLPMPDGRLVPALGYLEQYERLVRKSAKGDLTTAEIGYMIDRFDPAELYQFEQARDLSIALLEEWLVKYKFKNWEKTESSGKKVTAAMRARRAKSIAKKLNETSHWHSHSRGISMEVARRELQLRIEDIDAAPDLKEALTGYGTLLNDYRMRRGHQYLMIDCDGGYLGHG